MGDGIYSALSGAIAQTTALESTATNLANGSIVGYHSQMPVFREMLRQAGGDPNIRYAAVQSTAMTTEAGDINSTGRDLDVALPEKAYLTVQTDAGERYTRNGSLAVRADGTLTTRSGQVILSDSSGPIVVPPGASPSITADGEIRAGDATVGRLKIVTFPEPAWLTQEGASLLAATTDSGAPTPSNAQLTVGALEQSNANPVVAMTAMMSTSRLFDAVQRAIDTFHQADRRVATTTPGVT